MDSAFITASQGETVDGEETDGYQNENESIATEEGVEFNFTTIKGCAQAALDAQKMARVFIELDQAASKLEQLAAILRGACMNWPKPLPPLDLSTPAFHNLNYCINSTLSIHPQSLPVIFNSPMLLSSRTRYSAPGGQIARPCSISPYMSPAPSTVVSLPHALPLPPALAIFTPRPIPSACDWYSGFWGHNPHPTCSFDPRSPPHRLPHLH